MLQPEQFDEWKSIGVSTLAVPNNVALALNLANDTSCYGTNKYNCNLAFFFSPSLQNVSAG